MPSYHRGDRRPSSTGPSVPYRRSPRYHRPSTITGPLIASGALQVKASPALISPALQVIAAAIAPGPPVPLHAAAGDRFHPVPSGDPTVPYDRSPIEGRPSGANNAK